MKGRWNDKGRQGSEEDTQHSTSTQAVLIQSCLSLSNVIHLRARDDMKLEPRWVAFINSFSSLTYSSVIAIPGYFTPPVSNWGVRDELERAAICVDSVSRLYMYIHQPTYKLLDDFSWETFLKRGCDLAEDLARLANEVRTRFSSEKHSPPVTDALIVSKSTDYFHCSFSWRGASEKGVFQKVMTFI